MRNCDPMQRHGDAAVTAGPLFEQPVEAGSVRRALGDDDCGRCSLCGRQKPRVYRHRMDLGKFRVLEAIAGKHKNGVEWVKVQRDGGLIRDHAQEVQADDVHALRLTWFGLLARLARRSGMYQVTPAGWKFLAGSVGVPEWIEERGGEICAKSLSTVGVREVKGVVLDRDYWDRYGETAGGVA